MLCARCKQDKPVEAFSLAPRNTYREGRQSYCRACMAEYGKQDREKNRERYSEKNKERHKRTYNVSFETRLQTLLRATSSDRSALDFDWCWDRLVKQEFRCEITKIPLTYETSLPTSLSIDRIDSSKGYTKDNVRFVCWWINAAMGNWGLTKLKEFIKEWESFDSQQV
jgi:hypothetical protein